MPDDAAVLLAGAGMKPGRSTMDTSGMLNASQVYTNRAAFSEGVDVEDAGEGMGFVGDETGDVPVDPGEVTHDVGRPCSCNSSKSLSSSWSWLACSPVTASTSGPVINICEMSRTMKPKSVSADECTAPRHTDRASLRSVG
jgi:hypothetical protein